MTKGCKLDLVADRYSVETADSRFESLDEELEVRWRGESGFEEHGYRSLTAWFNKQLLKADYDEHGRETLGTRLEDEFETLTEGEDLQRGELFDHLERDGIDGERVVDDMISWSTMRTHLSDCLEAEKELQTAKTDWERRSIEYAEERLLEKVADSLRSYENKGDIADGARAIASIQVRLACPDCPTRVSLTEALDQGYVCAKHGMND